MSTRLVSAIARTGIPGIHQLVDSAVVELINEFDHSPDKNTLANTVLSIYGADHFLRDKSNRHSLLTHLDKSMARELCECLDLRTTDESNPWELLTNVKFGKKQQVVLLEYFGVPQVEEEDVSVVDNIAKVDINPRYGLFPHQNQAAFKVRSILKNNFGRVLLHMPTGSGKTRTTMSIISDSFRESSGSQTNHLVLWLADTEELCDQAVEEFEKAWAALGTEQVSIHKFYGKHVQDLSQITEGFVVAGVAKINQRLSKDQTELFKFSSNVDVVVFDEAHKVIAPTYEHLIGVIQATGDAKLIGLSATPGRATLDEEKNEKFAKFFNNQKIILEIDGYKNPTDFLQEKGYLAKIETHKLPYLSSDLELTSSQTNYMLSGGDVPQKVLNKLGDDTKRNIIIVNTIIERVGYGDSVIVFACSVAHAKAIAALLKYKHLTVGVVTGVTPENERREIISSYKTKKINVIINFGVLTTGFDAPVTNVALIARPTTSLMLYSQMVGRAIRGKLAGGNEIAHIYTVVDSEIPGFESLAEAFSHWNDSWN